MGAGGEYWDLDKPEVSDSIDSKDPSLCCPGTTATQSGISIDRAERLELKVRSTVGEVISARPLASLFLAVSLPLLLLLMLLLALAHRFWRCWRCASALALASLNC